MRLDRLCCGVALALALLAAAAPGLAAGIAQPPPGTKNFATPPAVPDYFTDESGPFHTRAGAHAASLGDEPRFTRPEPAVRAEIAPTRDRAAHRRYVSAHYRHHSGRLHHHASVRRTAYRSARHEHAAHRIASTRRVDVHVASRVVQTRAASRHHAIAAAAHHQPTTRHHRGGGARG